MKSSHVCRCCLSEACYKDISNEYYYGKLKEVYSTMIFDTFNIEISYEENSSRLICEECIVQLRSAAAFKKQVMHAEEAIVNRFRNGRVDIGLDVTPKLEIKDDFIDHITGEFEYDDGTSDHQDGSNNDDDFGWQDDYLVNNDDGQGELFAIKLESKELHLKTEWETAKNKQPLWPNRKGSNSSSNNIGNDGDVLVTVDDKKLEKRSKRKTSKNAKEKPIKKEDVVSKRKQLKAPISQTQRNIKQNSLKLINNSNICLFESLKTRFRCFYCKESYIKMTDLREHSKIHSNSNEKYLKLCINRSKGMSYKTVDISSLTCKLCSQSIKDLNELETHLIAEHKMEFASSEHLLIPYRLENDFRCVICDEEFHTFFKLSVHMNTHYTHNVCEICGMSYINRLSLRMHVHSVHKEKKCSVCPAMFLNTYSRIKHMRKVHNTSCSKRYCLLCNKTFPYTYLLEEHKIKDHGAKRQLSSCSECGKAFLTLQNLKIHIRSVHIKERNYPCDFCEMRFFTKCDKRRHERTHEDIRSFACSYCEGRFKSKDSMRRHLKRQHGHLFISNLT